MTISMLKLDRLLDAVVSVVVSNDILEGSIPRTSAISVWNEENSNVSALPASTMRALEAPV